jgi:predicted transcriptional regulator
MELQKVQTKGQYFMPDKVWEWGLSATAFIILNMFARYTTGEYKKYTEMSLNDIIDKTGFAKNTVKKGIRELKYRGIISIGSTTATGTTYSISYMTSDNEIDINWEPKNEQI